jgi:hypothetical protein
MLKRILAGVVLSLMLAGGAAAGPFEEGVAAYERGDYATALRLLRPLAEQGYASAQHNLGVAYGEGQGVPQDYVLAHMWFNLAASRFSGSEEEYRDKAVKNRDFVASKMTPAQLTEAQRLAREWRPK